MTLIYFAVLILVIPPLFLLNQKDFKKNKNKKYLNSLIYCYLIFVFVFFAGLRDIASITLNEIRTNDEYRYRVYFDSLMGTSFSFNKISSFEWGRYIVDWTLANLFKDSQFWIFFYAFFTNILFISAIKKYVKPFWIGVLIYITLGMYTFQMNATTQMLAAAIITLSFKHIINKSFWRFLLILILAGSIHVSAYLFLPMYFYEKLKRPSKNTIVAIMIGIVIMLNFNGIANSFLQYTPYEFYLSKINENSYGVNIYRVLLFLALFIFIINWMKKYTKLNNLDVFFINNLIVLIVINIVSISYVYVSRIELFFQMSIIYLLARMYEQYRGRYKYLLFFLIFSALILFGYQQNLGTPYGNVVFNWMLEKF